MLDVQQSKAKSFAFDKVDNNSAFWLCDFNKKNHPYRILWKPEGIFWYERYNFRYRCFLLQVKLQYSNNSLHDCSNTMCYSCSRVTILMLPFYTNGRHWLINWSYIVSILIQKAIDSTNKSKRFSFHSS